MGQFDGKVAIVTGAARGIGRAIAEALAREGAAIAFNYGSSEKEADSLSHDIASRGGRAWASRADMADVAAVKQFVADAAARFGRLDILVNNAGTGMLGPLESVDADSFDRVFAINARGAFFAIQETAKHLGEGGRIINISSSTTVFPMAGTSVYAASKMVPRTLTAVLAKELGSRGITINAVLPGPTAPGMFERVPDAMKASAAASSPMNRIGTANDIADVVVFLASDAARWVTGQDILVNGGATI